MRPQRKPSWHPARTFCLWQVTSTTSSGLETRIERSGDQRVDMFSRLGTDETIEVAVIGNDMAAIMCRSVFLHEPFVTTIRALGQERIVFLARNQADRKRQPFEVMLVFARENALCPCL